MGAASRHTSRSATATFPVILISGELLFLLKDNAELIVALASGSGFEPLHRYTVADSAMYANPLMLAKGIVIKDSTTSFLSWE